MLIYQSLGFFFKQIKKTESYKDKTISPPQSF